MDKPKKYIAVDLGAESGRVITGIVSDDKVSIDEAYRFANHPVKEGNSLRWDFARLLSEIKCGIKKAWQQSGKNISGIAIDSWGADFGLLDENGKLLENPYHYRDNRTSGVMDKAFELMDKREIYENTGIQFMLFNNLYQLLSMRLTNSDILAKAKQLLFTADLYAYHLCGKAYAEYTLASTSQLMDMRTGKWSGEIFKRLSLPIDIMPEIVPSGTIVERLTTNISREIGCEQIPVIAVGSHDTACAVAAVPAKSKNWAFISSGTWSLMGVEIPKAIINGKTFKYQFTNEGGVDNTVRLLKNIMGLWLVQECRNQWQKEGEELSYAELTDAAKKAEPFVGCIDTDAEEFYSPGNMPERINAQLVKSGQKRIEDKGQIARIILESLAMKYKYVIKKIEDIIGKEIECLHIVGGGSQNSLLCQFTADSTGKNIIAGPVEATAIGNILTQAKANGQIKDLAHLREMVQNSFLPAEYYPRDTMLWEKNYRRCLELFNNFCN